MKNESLLKKSEKYYDEMSIDYDAHVKYKPYEAYRNEEIIKTFLELIPKNKKLKILDVGCGTGEYTIAEFGKVLKGCTFHGLDFSKGMIKEAKRLLPKSYFKVGDAHNLPYKNNSFDLVVSRQALEHFIGPQKVVREMARVTKKGGKVIISTPSWFGLIAPFYFLRKMSGKMQPIDNWASSSYLRKLYYNAGLKVDIITSRCFVVYHEMLPNFLLRWVKKADKILKKSEIFRKFGRIIFIKGTK